MTHDVIVAGLGAMGAATAHELAARGARVLALDRFAPPHTMGSTHGLTRIIREAYYEHPLYVPLVRRAYERWRMLEEEAGRPLFLPTGGLMVGPPDGVLVAGARRSVVEHALPHEEMPIAEARRRWPALRGGDDWVALHEPRAGLLLPEDCVRAFLDGARARGAALRTDDAVDAWRIDGSGVSVTTHGATYRAAHLVLAVGAWLPRLVPELAGALTVERQVFHWFAAADRPETLRPDRLPIALWEYAPDRIFCTFADTGDGVKAQIHHEGETVDPDTVARRTTPDEEARSRAQLERCIPDANGALLRTAVCLYTNTPDHHFALGPHPDHPQVTIVSPCSGHGFKFAGAIGELAADLALGAPPRFDLAPFAIDRLLPS
jgi:sarcosine oxidase